MKVLLCGGAATLANEAVRIADYSGACMTFKTHSKLYSDGVRFDDGQSRFAFDLSMLMGDMLKKKAMYDPIGDDALLLAYDMPVMMPYWSEQPFLPRQVYGRLPARGVDAAAWNVCLNIARAAYSKVGFDYVFAFDGAPELDALIGNGITTGGANVVRVGTWQDALSVMKAG